ncbi:MAG: flagellar hook-basal body complex protein, partial [Rhodospirillales bacterium]|nr:flagellar hook-basal body complex protein [Rhodospirillales bacterium]
TQFAGNFTVSQINSNGASFGQLNGVTVSESGKVTAHFNNGEQRVIFEVPVATFSNPEGLGAATGNVYHETDSSGHVTLRTGGLGGAGTVQQSALEQSNVDLGTEFVRVIQAQAAYSFSIKALRAGDQLAEDLLDIKS